MLFQAIQKIRSHSARSSRSVSQRDASKATEPVQWNVWATTTTSTTNWFPQPDPFLAGHTQNRNTSKAGKRLNSYGRHGVKRAQT
jgi:hypothetical protein